MISTLVDTSLYLQTKILKGINMFTLKKVQIEEGSKSAVPIGYVASYPNLKLLHPHTREVFIPESMKDLREGYQVLIYSLTEYLRTSPISKIQHIDDGYAVFKTQTSTYELKGYFD